jgi:hypothetical protein
MIDFQTPLPPLSGIVRISDPPDIRHASQKLTQPCLCQEQKTFLLLEL